MNKLLTGSVALAMAGGSALAACTPPPKAPPVTVPGPATGCYPSPVTPHDADLLVVGAPNADNALEVYDGGSNCSTNDFVASIALRYVKAIDESAALALCQSLDKPADDPTQNVVDLSPWMSPSPGLAGYYACSPK
jgi:hypothetical protein